MKNKKIDDIEGEKDGFDPGRKAVHTSKGYAFEPHASSEIAMHSKTFPVGMGIRAIEKLIKPCSCDRCRRDGSQ